MKILSIIFSVSLLLFINILPIKANENNYLPLQGYKAPTFNLKGYSTENPNKEYWNSQDFLGSWVVLYFYPQDFTTGCTIEAKGFEKLNKQFIKRNTKIIGVSKDINDQHPSFCLKNNLNFVLLTDKDGSVSKRYDSWQREYSKRNTFLIDPEGVISYKWLDAIPSRHASEVLDKLKELQT